MTDEQPIISQSIPPYFAKVFYEADKRRYRVVVEHESNERVETDYVCSIGGGGGSVPVGDMTIIRASVSRLVGALKKPQYPAPPKTPKTPPKKRKATKVKPPPPPTPDLNWITPETLIRDLWLSTRCVNALTNNHGHPWGEDDRCFTVADMLAKTDAELLRLPNFGRKSLAELKPIRAMFAQGPPPRGLVPEADQFHRWCERNRGILEPLRRNWRDYDPDFEPIDERTPPDETEHPT